MKKALVINLTRFGDLLQTQPVISALSAQGYETGIMCLENFAGTTKLMRDVSITFPLPGAALLASLDDCWHDALQLFESQCAEIENKLNPDLIINLTPSVAGRLIALRLGKGRELRGFAMDSFGFNADTSQWALFLQMASANRGSSPFNIVDLFSRVAGLESAFPFHLADPDLEMKIAALKFLSDLPEGSKGFVGFQPGASEDRRRWPVSYFQELGSLIWNELGLVPVLLGTEKERGLGQRILQDADFPAVNLMGSTSLPELSAVLRRLDFLVTNDTGTMHLAAGAGTPVAAVFLATAQPWDTGPAAENCVCFEPDVDCHPCPFGAQCPFDLKCRRQVSAKVVFKAVSGFTKNGKWPLLKDEGARIYLTGRDCEGFIRLESLSGHEDTDRYKWTVLQRKFYRRFLDGEDFSTFAIDDVKFSEDFKLSLQRPLSECRDMLFLLTRQAVLLQADPMQTTKMKFLANLQRIQDILYSSEYLSVLSSLWELEVRSQESMRTLAALLDRYMNLVTALCGAMENDLA